MRSSAWPVAVIFWIALGWQEHQKIRRIAVKASFALNIGEFIRRKSNACPRLLSSHYLEKSFLADLKYNLIIVLVFPSNNGSMRMCGVPAPAL
jgi:hypothetical protein